MKQVTKSVASNQKGSVGTGTIKGRKVSFFEPADNQPDVVEESVLSENVPHSLHPYATRFLLKTEPIDISTAKQQISKRSHTILTMLSRYSKQCGNEIGITALLDNILKAHFLDHRDSMIQIQDLHMKAEIARLDSIVI